MSDTLGNNSYSEMQRRKIDSVLPQHIELIAMASGKLFSSNKDGKIWLFSDLEGFICFLADYTIKTTYLVLYDSYSFEKLFQFELYKDFNKYFQKLAPDFRCFEVESGFLGLQFDLPKEADVFDVVTRKFSGKLLDDMFNTKLLSKKQGDDSSKEKAQKFCEMLKNNWLKHSGKKYDASYAEQGLEIVKARNFAILNNINYNNVTKRFEIGEISNELKQLFIELGVRKKDLKDVDFAFWLFKRLILGIGNDKKTSTKQLENIPEHFPEPDANEEEEDTIQQVQFTNTNTTTPKSSATQKTTSKSDNKKPQQVKSTVVTSKTVSKVSNTTLTSSTIPAPPKGAVPPPPKSVPSLSKSTVPPPSKGAIPPPPKGVPPPPKVPAPPKSVPSPSPNIPPPPKGAIPPPPKGVPVPPPVPQIPNVPVPQAVPSSSSTTSEPELSREEQLKAAMKLKKVEVSQKPRELTMEEQIQNVKLTKVDPNVGGKRQIITKNEKNFLQSALASAIANRKKNLMEHEDSDSDEDDSDW